ncbi:ligand-effect modulator 3 family, partial [Blyttiomyces helicus]
WKQQLMPSWQPVLTPRCALVPVLFITLSLFVLGGWLYWANSTITEITIDYTECSQAPPILTENPDPSSPIQSWSYTNTTRTCRMQFSIPNQLPSRVLMYVRISNMYQNHRLYVSSLSADQLSGTAFKNAGDITGDCGPVQAPIIAAAASNAQYYPCGLIANSMFLDDISNLTCISGPSSTSCTIPTFEFSDRGIAWPSDSGLYGETKWLTDSTLQPLIPNQLIPPPQWRAARPDLWGNGYVFNATTGTSNLPDLKNWERFQVWMRKAGLPTFRKLWGRNDSSTLEAGIWEVSVTDSTYREGRVFDWGGGGGGGGEFGVGSSVMCASSVTFLPYDSNLLNPPPLSLIRYSTTQHGRSRLL